MNSTRPELPEQTGEDARRHEPQKGVVQSVGQAQDTQTKPAKSSIVIPALNGQASSSAPDSMSVEEESDDPALGALRIARMRNQNAQLLKRR